MSVESRRVLRRIDAAVQDLEQARVDLAEVEGQEPDYFCATCSIDNAIDALNKAKEICDEQE